MRFVILLLCIVALIVLVGTLHADSSSQQSQPAVAATPDSSDLVVGETFPEPISTVFILAGAAAMGLWKLARRFRLV
ncbi:MAG: hypothetical protein JXL80_01375 [Planctomycetes bacterium]|nr:hypothetical protein [Planctomycetota bacterium]